MFGATSEQQRPNNRENLASAGTRRRSQPLRMTTLYGLQNLHPRFKSGRRLQNFRRNLGTDSQAGTEIGLQCARIVPITV